MNGKRVLIALLALAVALLCSAAALAESDTVTKDGVTVNLDYTCKGEDGTPHTSHASITNVKITRTNVNQLKIDISFRTYCDQDPNHGERRNTWYSFGRSSCTFPIRRTDRTSEQDFPNETRVLDITVDGVPHQWIGGRCIVCNSKCFHEDSTNQPTCTQGAICSVCGNSLRALGHNVIVDPAVEPACLTGGKTEGSHCGRCQTVLQAQEDLPALGHDPVTDAAVEPTCLTGGKTEGSHCGRCQTVLQAQEDLPALGHDPVTDAAVEPTCLTGGKTEGSHCGRCQTVLKAQEDLPALGHDPVTDAAVEPACLTGGKTEGSHCGRCQTVLKAQEELPALGHDYQTETVEPTCEAGGYRRHTCTRCGDTYTEKTAKKLSHWFGEWIPNADDTHSAPCLREGCKHTGKADCQKFPYVLTIENQEEPLEIILCPVCGELTGGARLELEEKAQALAETESLPAGELVLRLGETEGVSLLSVAFEFGGRLTQPEGQVRITLPAAAVEGSALMLLDETGGETEVPVEIRDEEATFLLDFTPQEGEEPSPVRLIRLIPNP